MEIAYSILEQINSIFYAVFLFVLNFKRPVRRYGVRCSDYHKAYDIPEDEWLQDSVKPGTRYLFEGSEEDSTFHVSLTITENACYGAVALVIDNRKLFGEFNDRLIDGATINCGPLLIERREPFRKWRLNFKGCLRDQESHEDIFVTFGGWWKATSDARYFATDLSAKNIIASSQLGIKEKIENIEKIHHVEDISQFGQIHLEITIGGERKEHRFRGIRQLSPLGTYETIEECSVSFDDGNRVFSKSASLDKHRFQVDHGYIARSNRLVVPTKLSNREALNEGNLELLSFIAEGSDLKVRKDSTVAEFFYETVDGKVVRIAYVKVDSVLSKGTALIRRETQSLKTIEEDQHLPLHSVAAMSIEKSSVLPIHLRSCQDKLLCGGKGANLAILNFVEKDYKVPTAVVVTTQAFDNFLSSHKALKKIVDKLSTPALNLEEYVAIGVQIQEKLRTVEATEIEAITKGRVPNGVERKYAVRSSAVGEDGSELSSAGQLESVLNVDYSEIPNSIIECWCSNYRKEVITYRRTYGQILNPPMAVVIQEMITDGIAGVMFTCDPVKNDTGRIVINAIQGMGEDIVSGAITPDEIAVEKNGLRVVKPTECCMNDSQINHLVKVGLYLEKLFGRPQDVEFVVKDKEVFLVQSRDVTGRERESHFELITEFDSSSLTNSEMFTTANVGEVVPVPETPLEISATFHVFDKVMTNMSFREHQKFLVPHHYNLPFVLKHQRLLFNIGEMFGRMWEVIEKDRLAEISVAGVPMIDEVMMKQLKIRFGRLPKLFPIKRLIFMMRTLFIDSYARLDEIQKICEQAEKATPNSDVAVEKLLQILEERKSLLAKSLECHADESMFSSFTYIIVGMLIRGSDVGETTPEILSDLANLYSNSTSDVISADVPASLNNLAKAIEENGIKGDFMEKDGDEALNFLLQYQGKAGILAREFMENHGHRGPKELYLRAKSWKECPDQLIATIKAVLSSELYNKEKAEPKSTDELIDSLKCQPTGIRRWLMKFMVNQSHRGVAFRETAKNYLVKTIYESRMSTRLLAKKLTDEGYLPDEDLIFFFTTFELRELRRTRSARLIARAMRRRQIFDELETYQYKHIYHGNIERINTDTLEELHSTVSLTGTVVCEGKVVARARVAKNLDEAKLTKPGEILITRCTDICWSPFFPIIKGIVTEIGGLLSHGAVVAREYGLPSLIAVENATNVFQTGDLVELDTFLGVVRKINEIEE